MTSPVDARAFGALEAEVKHLREDMADVKAALREQTEILNQARGGWKVMVAVGGVAGLLGASTTKILTFLGWR